MNPTYNAQVRKELKKNSKNIVVSHLGRCIGIQFLYTVPYLLLTLLLYVALFGGVFSLMLSGVTDERLLTMALLNGMNGMWLVLLLMLLISGPLTYGMMRFYIGLHRGKEPGATVLFTPFASLRSAWTGIKMSFCLFFRGLLWLIGPTFVYFLLAVAIPVGMMASGYFPSNGSMMLLNIAFFIVVLLIDVKLMSYNAGWVLLYDNEEYGAWAATRDAAAAFKGHFWDLLVFVLSFFGWALLSVGVTYLCVGIGIAAMSVMQGGAAVTVLVLALVAALCLSVVLDGFISSYSNVSFISLYEHLSASSVCEGDASAVWTAQGGADIPAVSDAAPQETAEVPEQPADAPAQDAPAQEEQKTED
ncbi:DUF975 family protein [Agathobaculum desmolans]|uniref:DUF975 family protein n=1 Tax=Agathobaculum desmolans TaxID=39484 RepID=UPI000558BB07|nr:DUF975 family protein [Agathobaculum desmolans]